MEVEICACYCCFCMEVFRDVCCFLTPFVLFGLTDKNVLSRRHKEAKPINHRRRLFTPQHRSPSERFKYATTILEYSQNLKSRHRPPFVRKTTSSCVRLDKRTWATNFDKTFLRSQNKTNGRWRHTREPERQKTVRSRIFVAILPAHMFFNRWIRR